MDSLGEVALGGRRRRPQIGKTMNCPRSGIWPILEVFA
jgi:hypothetical protein